MSIHDTDMYAYYDLDIASLDKVKVQQEDILTRLQSIGSPMSIYRALALDGHSPIRSLTEHCGFRDV
jgi:hypothetical protein